MTALHTKKKTRLIVRKRDEYIALKIDEVAFIYRDESIIVVVDKAEKKYLVDKNLTQLESDLDSLTFFRANRQYLININYIRSFKTVDKVKLQVHLKIPHAEHQIIISQKIAPTFKKWLQEG
jgi:DNA-binding LytR/AlgR family response regulator